MNASNRKHIGVTQTRPVLVGRLRLRRVRGLLVVLVLLQRLYVRLWGVVVLIVSFHFREDDDEDGEWKANGNEQ